MQTPPSVAVHPAITKAIESMLQSGEVWQMQTISVMAGKHQNYMYQASATAAAAKQKYNEAVKFLVSKGAYSKAEYGLRCEQCGHLDFQVLESRPAPQRSVRRRRECLSCGTRVTTYEIAERQVPWATERDESQIRAMHELRLHLTQANHLMSVVTGDSPTEEALQQANQHFLEAQGYE